MPRYLVTLEATLEWRHVPALGWIITVRDIVLHVATSLDVAAAATAAEEEGD